jgi:peroxiredoxin
MRKTILLVFLSFTLLASGKFKTTQVGDIAPDFTYNVNDSTKAKLSDYKGKVVMLTFFATWCPPCKRELPFIQHQIWDIYKDNPNFSLLIFGRGNKRTEIEKFKASTNLTLPLFPDANQNIYYLYAYEIIPRTYIIDKTGKVVYKAEGFNEIEFQKMLEILEKLLSQ